MQQPPSGGTWNQLVWWGCTTARKGYKAAAVDSWSSHATNFHQSHLKTRSTHAPQVKEKGIRWCGGDTLPPVK
ncbi:hypothetical protein V1477_004075 [Vespula maculifrons]|uniref:Uncharacterized protein n=1 Tax=Vespula maculifrons TaxID=7453 RepID=A0ABD2CQI8_VESMC